MTQRNSEQHRAKMAAKKAARPNIVCGFTHIDGALTRQLIAAAQLRGQPILPGPAMRRYDRLRVAVPASINRRTGKPHEHRREIARRLAA